MKKFFTKLTGVVLALTLLLSFAVPVRANVPGDIEISFDHASEISVSLDIRTRNGLGMQEQMILDILADGVILAQRGTVYVDGAAFVIAQEFAVRIPSVPVPGLNIRLPLNLELTVRAWLNVDFTDLENPKVVAVAEISEIPELMIALLQLAGIPEINYQFFVLDLSEIAAEFIADFELIQISPEEVEEILSYVRYEIDNLRNVANVAEIIARVRNFLDSYVTYSFDTLDNGFAAAVRLEFANDDIDLSLSFNGQITNINSAEKPRLPNFTDANSFDVLASLFAL